MNKRANKIWMKACKDAEKEKGYVPAELLAIPTLVKLAELDKIELVYDEQLGMDILRTVPKRKIKFEFVD
jgi:hypothetical protein